ncbi:MAG: hypothetical protein ABIV21_02565, partial [Pyrinomonadaceae bacterium]
MKISERFYNWVFPPPQQNHKRLYAAGKVGRTNDGWLTSPETANYALRLGTRILRARARQMCGDAPHFKKF